MEGLHKTQGDLERVIDKEDTSTVAGSDSEETLKHGPFTIREKADHIIHSHRFQVAVIVLVIIDVLLVIGELLFDLQIITHHNEHIEIIPHVLHYCSIAILSVFLVEIAVRLFVLRLEIFKHKLELFDSVVIIVSFVLDVVYRTKEDAMNGVGLIVVLRLWRVGRIVNGIVLSVKRQAHQKLDKERTLREACDQELRKFRTYCSSLEGEIDYLHRLLKQHGIQYTEKIQKRPVSRQISVEVELNHRATGMNHRGAGEADPKFTEVEVLDHNMVTVEDSGGRDFPSGEIGHVNGVVFEDKVTQEIGADSLVCL